MGLNVHVVCKYICNRVNLVVKGASCASVNNYVMIQMLTNIIKQQKYTPCMECEHGEQLQYR
jgi:hypothetical protein